MACPLGSKFKVQSSIPEPRGGMGPREEEEAVSKKSN